MTRSDADTRDVCPICGSTLVVRGHSLYCPSCDLVYEADDDTDAGDGAS
jgi:uncharacterized Zn finger protein (UPF0148 family)